MRTTLSIGLQKASIYFFEPFSLPHLGITAGCTPETEQHFKQFCPHTLVCVLRTRSPVRPVVVSSSFLSLSRSPSAHAPPTINCKPNQGAPMEELQGSAGTVLLLARDPPCSRSHPPSRPTICYLFLVLFQGSALILLIASVEQAPGLYVWIFFV